MTGGTTVGGQVTFTYSVYNTSLGCESAEAYVDRYVQHGTFVLLNVSQLLRKDCPNVHPQSATHGIRHRKGTA